MDLSTARSTFDRQLPKLISDGQRGKFGLVTKSGKVEVYDTGEKARAQGIAEFGLDADFFADVIDEWQPELVVASFTIAE